METTSESSASELPGESAEMDERRRIGCFGTVAARKKRAAFSAKRILTASHRAGGMRAIFAAGFAGAVIAQYPDEVTHLPGWNQSLPSKWYSGHVRAGVKDGKQLFHHYVLVESESDPANDPVIVWSNGGPGAPSLYGLMVELGPLLLSGDSTKTAEARRTGIPTLFRNGYSWTRRANLVVLNGPPPVGFSYCDPPGPHGGDFKKCGKWNDSSTAYHNRLAVEGILARRSFFFCGI